MKTLKFKTAMLFLLLFVAFNGKADYEKKIHKAWGIDKVEAFKIESKFSNINFVDGRNDSVTVDILIEIKHPSTNKAKELADEIDFVLYLKDGVVNAETRFDSKFRTNQDFQITYTVTIPNDRKLHVENKYGSVSLGKLIAGGFFDIKYGKIFGDQLRAPEGENIEMDLKYTDGTFDQIDRLKLDLGYGKLSVDKISDGIFETEYSIVNVDELETAKIDSKYDTYSLGVAGKIYAESKFTGWKIDELTRLFAIVNQFGNIDINYVDEGFELIDINNQYGSIEAGISEQASYSLEGDCYYCKMKHKDGEIIREIVNNHHTSIKLNIGEKAPQGKVKIESRYGKVDLSD